MAPGIGLVIMLACAAVFYFVGDKEYSSGLLLGAMSLGLWFASGFFLAFGLLGCILMQLGMFATLALWNIAKDKIKK